MIAPEGGDTACGDANRRMNEEQIRDRVTSVYEITADQALTDNRCVDQRFHS